MRLGHCRPDKYSMSNLVTGTPSSLHRVPNVACRVSSVASRVPNVACSVCGGSEGYSCSEAEDSRRFVLVGRSGSCRCGCM